MSGPIHEMMLLIKAGVPLDEARLLSHEMRQAMCAAVEGRIICEGNRDD